MQSKPLFAIIILVREKETTTTRKKIKKLKKGVDSL
ncbi:hypothetical protein BE24_0212 [Staphylococcus phage vB_SepM_BE24]|nr:hypothetical protein BE24_0212 [Staphylococcus phage vB_SepM_BE24]